MPPLLSTSVIVVSMHREVVTWKPSLFWRAPPPLVAYLDMISIRPLREEFDLESHLNPRFESVSLFSRDGPFLRLMLPNKRGNFSFPH